MITGLESQVSGPLGPSFSRSGSGQLPLRPPGYLCRLQSHLGLAASTKGAPTANLRRTCSGVASVVCAAFGRGGELQRVGGPDGRKRALLDYVRQVESSCVESFIASAQPSVVAAMKHTVSNMVGTLPPQHFGVNIETVADTLATLMTTMLKTGYMMRNAQYRLELQTALRAMQPAAFAAGNAPGIAAPALGTTSTSAWSLPAASAAPALPNPGQASTSGSSSSSEDESAAPAPTPVVGWQDSNDGNYAPGVQKTKVDGEVLRWHNEHGLEKMPAKQYMELLEAEVQALRAQLGQYGGPMLASSGSTSSTSSMSSVDFGLGPSSPVRPASASAAAGPWGGPAPALAGAAPLSLPPAMTTTPWSHSELLDFIRSLEPVQLGELGACDADVTEAMGVFVGRLMGTRDRAALRSMTSEFSAVELSKLLFWLLVVGWSLRCMEVRWELEEGFPAPPGSSSGGLPGLEGGSGGISI